MTARTCPIRACEAPLTGEQFMCGRHWALAPETVRRRVREAFRDWRGRWPEGEARAREFRAWSEARQAAIDAVNRLAMEKRDG